MIETYRLDLLVDENPLSRRKTPRAAQAHASANHPLLRHPTKRRNGLNYIMAVLGDNYQDIAQEYNIKLSKLLDYNDLAQVPISSPRWATSSM